MRLASPVRPVLVSLSLVCALVCTFVIGASTASATIENVMETGTVGLYSLQNYRLTNGHCTDCNAPKQALWYFQDDLVATPTSNAASFDATLRVQDDVKTWAQQFPTGDDKNPALLWMGSPQMATGELSADGTFLQIAPGQVVPFSVTEKIPANLSYYDASSAAHFAGRMLAARGTLAGSDFVARTIWPADYALDFNQLTLQPLQENETLMALVRQDGEQPAAPLAARLLWQRDANTQRNWQNKPVLAVMLNGAQGDDDEAHGGHFALVTGAFGEHGEWHHWLVNNFYNLGSVSEKGIIASMLPMDAYMADLNSGQAWYRPSYMLVAVLKQPRAIHQIQGALSRVYNHFYRQDFAYQHAWANCTGISMNTLRSLDWQIPERGPTDALKAVVALPFMTIKEGSLSSGEQAFDYLMAEQTSLYPFAGFDAIGTDLLQRIVAGQGKDAGLEAMLAEDIEALLYVRIPQFPSSRVYGQAPIASLDEYISRVPEDRSQWKIIPVGPRPFPPELKDPNAPAEGMVPSRMAAFAWAGVLGLAALSILNVIYRRLRKRA